MHSARREGSEHLVLPGSPQANPSRFDALAPGEWLVKPFFRIRIAPWGLSRTGSGDAVLVFESQGATIAVASGTVLIDRDFDFEALNSLTHRSTPEASMGVANIDPGRDGLYAVGIEWTPDAVEDMHENRYRFLVPAFKVDGMRRAQWVVGLAFTDRAIAGWPTIAELLALEAQPARRSRERRAKS
jgi:hypothetical protein